MRELDAKVATLVMGGRLTCPVDNDCGHSVGVTRWGTDAKRNFCELNGKEIVIPHYTSDPSADYEVLKHVRETWSAEQQNKFDDALEDIMIAHTGKYPNAWHSILYEPGDWSRAALKALGEI